MNEIEWARSPGSNIQHGQKRPRPVTRAAVLRALGALVALLAVLVGGIWWMVAG